MVRARMQVERPSRPRFLQRKETGQKELRSEVERQMTGVLLIAAAGVWALLAWRFSGWATRLASTKGLKWLIRLLAFAALLICPLADEIVGGFQFKSICDREAVLKIDPERVRGRTLKQIATQSFRADTVLRTEEWRNSFVDATTGEELASFKWLRMSGGWFIQVLGISEGNAPLSINPATCWPVIQGSLSEKYQFTLIKN
jgi:hypothetical protein